MTRKNDFLRLVVDKSPPAFGLKGVYLITDQGDRLAERVGLALSGGISAVQYRNKKMDDPDDRFSRGMEIKQLCARAGVPFIVNDDPDLARKLDADGLHLGQDDGDPIMLWNLTAEKENKSLKGHTSGVPSLCWGASGTVLGTAESDATDGALAPFTLDAVAVHVYVLPFDRLPTVIGDDEPGADPGAPPSEDVQVAV